MAKPLNPPLRPSVRTAQPPKVEVNGRSPDEPIVIKPSGEIESANSNGKLQDPLPYLERHQAAFIEQMCSEPELQEALSRCDSPKFLNFLAALCNPVLRVKQKWTATQLARAYNITPQELESIWRTHTLAKAMIKVVAQMPRIAEDLARDAQSKEVCCPRCDGWGEVQRTIKNRSKDRKTGEVVETQLVEQRQCPECKGSKVVRAPGDPDARKLTLETLGWAGKNQTLNNYGIIQNNGQGGVIDELEALDSTRRLPPPVDITPEKAD